MYGPLLLYAPQAASFIFLSFWEYLSAYEHNSILLNQKDNIIPSRILYAVKEDWIKYTPIISYLLDYAHPKNCTTVKLDKSSQQKEKKKIQNLIIRIYWSSRVTWLVTLEVEYGCRMARILRIFKKLVEVCVRDNAACYKCIEHLEKYKILLRENQLWVILWYNENHLVSFLST